MSPTPPLDPTSPAGAKAERALNEVLAGVLTRLAREDATTPPSAAAVPPPAAGVHRRKPA